jgi:hypothetical protein
MANPFSLSFWFQCAEPVEIRFLVLPSRFIDLEGSDVRMGADKGEVAVIGTGMGCETQFLD